MLRRLVGIVFRVVLGVLLSGLLLGVLVPLGVRFIGPRSVWLVVLACLALVVVISWRDRNQWNAENEHS